MAGACVGLRRVASRDAFWLLAAVLGTVVVLHLAVTVVDTNIFQERYMTAIIPLAAAVLAGAIASLPWGHSMSWQR